MAIVNGENLVVLKHDELVAEMIRLNHGQVDPALIGVWLNHHDLSATVRGSQVLGRPEPQGERKPWATTT